MVLIKYNINGMHVCSTQVIENTRMAQKLIKHCSEDDKITFIIRRIPNGKIFAVRRSENGESLGIRREGGTGEVSSDLLRLSNCQGVVKLPEIPVQNLPLEYCQDKHRV